MDSEQLTSNQRRERFLTLLMIGIFALLTGNEIFERLNESLFLYQELITPLFYRLLGVM